MIALPKAALLSGLPDSDPPAASNTDEPVYSVKHQPQPALSRIEPLGDRHLIRLVTARHLRLRVRTSVTSPPIAGANHPGDQASVDLIIRNVVALARSHASRKGWVTRERLEAARAAGKGKT
jgi:hypothetical protein